MELLPSSLWPVFFDSDCVTPSSGLRVYFDFISIFFSSPGLVPHSLTSLHPPLAPCVSVLALLLLLLDRRLKSRV